MSLKAKIEAVIYASEEPVTLVQLVSLLSEEAQAELDALAAQQESLPLEEGDAENAADPEALNAETTGESAETAPVEESAGAAQDAAAPCSGLAEPEGTLESAAPTREAAQKTEAAAARARDRRLRDYFRSLLDQLMTDYASDERGLEIREVAGGFRFATKPQYHDAVRGFVKSLKPPLKLSLQALETLAVIAYKQPITAPEISEIRGVDSGGVLGSLMARKLVATAGRKQVIGRPILYKTTKDFLVRFGLKDINELPSIEEFEKMAGEFAEAGEFAVQEEIPMPSAERVARRSEEDASANMHESQADGVPYSEENLNDETPSAVPDGAADEVLTDGRLSGLPPNYDAEDVSLDEAEDSPALDAEVQSHERDGGA
ncbi:MAG TPA: SMC-Scp complex subunit ScpB [Acidobacteriaceae bacterium]|nr:SMC-Scp complex subunit ScpB [Acidobacteriaceae bacterium]